DGVFEDARGEQLDLVGGRAPVRILEGHDLALFRDAETAVDRSRRLGGNRPRRWRAPAADRSASSMEKGNRHARVTSDPGQLRLRLVQFPVRGEKSAVPVRI